MHTGSHKLNNALGQCLLAKRMGKPRIIAETGAGQHGVATATACALLGLECVVYMGTEDIRRQMPNVQRMRLLGATVSGVDAGLAHAQGGGLGRDPRLGGERRRHALRDRLVRRAGAVPGARARPAAGHRRRGARPGARALRPAAVARRSPASAAARTRSARSSRSSTTPSVELVGVEAAGEGLATGRHGAPLTIGGRGGVLHGSYSAIMQDEDGQITEAHSISAGLDYPGVGPEHAWLRDTGRARYEAVTDAQALDAFQRLAELEGIIPALESSHAVAWVLANPPAGRRSAGADLPLRPRRQGPRRGAGPARTDGPA